MIIFYEKSTGEIIGTVDGRIHGADHLKMWIGDTDTTDRIVCQWVKYSDGSYYPELSIFSDVEKSANIRDEYIVDTNSKTVVKKVVK